MSFVLAVVKVLGPVIFIHELGHFLVAKLFGMRVLVFSFGFGHRLLGFKWGDTDYRLSLIPLGGYVKLEGEPDDKLTEDTSQVQISDGRDFAARPRWQKFLVYLAGPVMNFVLTIGILSGLLMIGLEADAARFDRPLIGAVDAGSAAEAAGLKPGDEVLSLAGQDLPTWDDLHYAVLVHPGAEVPVRVRRDGVAQSLTLKVGTKLPDRVGEAGMHPLVRVGQVLAGTPAEGAGLKADDAILRIDGKPITSFGDIPPLVQASQGKALALSVLRAGELVDLTVTPRADGGAYRIGIGPKLVLRKFAPLPAVREGARWAWDMTKQTFDIVGRLLTARLSPKTMSGPIGIASEAQRASEGGLGQLLFLVAMISLQVGIMNLLPIPPLDGGHLAVFLGEGLIRREFSMRAKEWIFNTGFAALLLLIGFVLYSDLSKTSWLGRFLP